MYEYRENLIVSQSAREGERIQFGDIYKYSMNIIPCHCLAMPPCQY